MCIFKQTKKKTRYFTTTSIMYNFELVFKTDYNILIYTYNNIDICSNVFLFVNK